MTSAATSADTSSSPRPFIVDGLNCAGVSREQFERTLAGGVRAINLTAVQPWSDLPQTLKELETNLQIVEAMPDLALVVRSADDITRAADTDRLGVIIGAQHSLMVEKDVSLLAAFKRLGMRILQPTYNEPCAFGQGAPDTGDADRGMTELGRQWVAEMHRNRLLIDLSHCGHRTSADFIAAAKAPVVFSHANAYAVCPSPRNKTDALLRAVAETGGLTGAVMWSPAVKHATRPTLEDYLDHVDHIVRVAGVEHVALASDITEGHPQNRDKWEKSFGPRGLYPNITGILGPWYEWETRLNVDFSSLTHMPRILDGLARRGYSEGQIERIASGNWMRVARDVWG
ncbi:dipeptidase [Alsobacter sp. SYSU M60028]|uniref:Dipeptidase n=1 Tax=Alsobacter ponti TaxID=2962936 RepID=A0ABT1LHS2_9HYPH|nr:membrane dipeptidase [Alsobacter ponti]MCP8941057.1 dipeptidase [Alsobacter ponti]